MEMPTTQWTQLLLVARDPGAARAELAELCGRYWRPAHDFLVRRGYRDKAEDLTQGFFAQILDGEFWSHIDPARGSFRKYLIAALIDFSAHEHRRQRALKRGGNKVVVPFEHLEAREPGEPGRLSHDLTPEEVFQRRWADTIIERATRRLERIGVSMLFPGGMAAVLLACAFRAGSPSPDPVSHPLPGAATQPIPSARNNVTVVQGTVLTFAGKPLQGASITPVGWNREGGREHGATQVTDEAGWFHLTIPPLQRTDLLVFGPGHSITSIPIWTDGERVLLRVRLPTWKAYSWETPTVHWRQLRDGTRGSAALEVQSDGTWAAPLDAAGTELEYWIEDLAPYGKYAGMGCQAR